MADKVDIRVIPSINENYKSCSDCIYCDDAEELCILRRCIHAVNSLREGYVPKDKEESEEV